MTHDVTFTTGSFSTDADSHTHAIVISYANNRNHAIYLNVTVEEAKRRFTERMNERHPFEIEREGWEATIRVAPVKDELWIAGTFGEDLQEFSQQLIQEMLRGQKD